MMIIGFPIIYPLLFVMYCMFGLILIIVVGSILKYLLELCKDNPDEFELKDAKQGILMGLCPIWKPIVIMYEFVTTGEFNMD